MTSGRGQCLTIYDLDTPCLLLDIDVLQANIARVQQAANAAGVGLRPHIKAHKTPQVGLMQVRAGAIGITAAKVSEAQVFAAAGIEDVFIANQVIGPPKLARLVALSRDTPRLSVAVDSLEGARQLSGALVEAGGEISVMLEVNGGADRCGVPPGRLVEFAEQVAELPALRIVGVFAYAGGAPYTRQGPAAVAEWVTWESAFLAEQAASLRAAGFDVQRVSGGCTPAAMHYQPDSGLTEIRPGTYALNDRNQIDLGACTEENVATTVLSTVISTPAEDRVILDAGSKALATQVGQISDGFGWVYGRSGGVLYRINDEHGYLDPRPMGWSPRIGEKLRIIPPRICTCLNLYDEMVVISGERVVDVWRVAGRGANQ